MQKKKLKNPLTLSMKGLLEIVSLLREHENSGMNVWPVEDYGHFGRIYADFWSS